MVVSVDSVRNLPSLALFGHYLPAFFLVAVLFFLLPVSFISAELSAVFSKDECNGIYHWVANAYNDHAGMFAIWSQWGSNAIWFPANLLFMSSTFLTIISPNLASSHLITTIIMIAIFLFVTLLNLKGVKESAVVAFLCMIMGVVIPVILLLASFIFWLIKGYPLQFFLSLSHLVFPLNSSNIAALTAIIISFLGMELSSVHVSRVINPKKTYTLAIWVATILVVAIMFLGAISIALILPKDSINIYNGLSATFSTIFSKFNLTILTPAIIIMIVLGSLGSAISWSISPAKGMAEAAQKGFLPKVLAKENNAGSPYNMLILQAIIISCLSLSLMFFNNISNFYWILISLNTEVYLLMYLLMFASAIKLRKSGNYSKTIIQSDFLFYMIAIAGIIGTLFAFIVGFIPSSAVIQGMSTATYLTIYIAGVIIMCLLFLLFVFYKKHTAPDKYNRNSIALASS
ncbi:APC family permease [Piscirickettsia litoralis]|nr:APC family permease [Piscirickettsia litoralis]